MKSRILYPVVGLFIMMGMFSSCVVRPIVVGPASKTVVVKKHDNGLHKGHYKRKKGRGNTTVIVK